MQSKPFTIISIGQKMITQLISVSTRLVVAYQNCRKKFKETDNNIESLLKNLQNIMDLVTESSKRFFTYFEILHFRLLPMEAYQPYLSQMFSNSVIESNSHQSRDINYIINDMDE